MSTSLVPPLFARLVDDAAVFPPGNAPLAEAVSAHRQHRQAWYESLVGPLLLPVDGLAEAKRQTAVKRQTEVRREADPRRPAETGDPLVVGLIGDIRTIGDVSMITQALPSAGLLVRQLETPVAKRGEDPLPGVRDLLGIAASLPELDVYAEIPLTLGLLGALDLVARARRDGVRIAPKFRTGGLAGELFPTPAELAVVICACRDRDLPFKLTAGLHRAVRHSDPETGFTHHGFLNILAASALAADGAEPAGVAETLASTDPVSLVEAVARRLDQPRPLWTGFGSCSVAEPLGDLSACGLLER